MEVKKMKSALVVIVLLAVVLLIDGCGLGKNGPRKGLNLFSIDQDKELGLQVSSQISSDPTNYPILDSTRYAGVYQYLYKVRNKILNSGNVARKDDFEWRIQVIHDDNTLNAFCTPGGYIYFYTGILHYLESEDQLAGVLGHEIGHADLRHSTRQLTATYGLQTMLELIGGNVGTDLLAELTAGLVSLKFSRNHEKEADERSVHYLCATDYNAAGGAGFFEKIQAQGDGANVPQFLSTHPNPDNRIEQYYNQKTTKGCQGNQKYISEYQQMVKQLPGRN